MNKLKRKLKNAMRVKNINQNELADKSRLSPATISRILKNPVNSSIENVVKIGEILGFSAKETLSQMHGNSFIELPMKIEFFCSTHEDFVFFMTMIKEYYISNYSEDYFNEIYRGY